MPSQGRVGDAALGVAELVGGPVNLVGAETQPIRAGLIAQLVFEVAVQYQGAIRVTLLAPPVAVLEGLPRAIVRVDLVSEPLAVADQQPFVGVLEDQLLVATAGDKIT